MDGPLGLKIISEVRDWELANLNGWRLDAHLPEQLNREFDFVILDTGAGCIVM